MVVVLLVVLCGLLVWRVPRLRVYLVEQMTIAHAHACVAVRGPMDVAKFVDLGVKAVRAHVVETVSGFVLPREVRARVSRMDLASWGPDAERVPFRLRTAVMSLVDGDELVALIPPVIVVSADPYVAAHHPRFEMTFQHVAREATSDKASRQGHGEADMVSAPTRRSSRSGGPTQWHPVSVRSGTRAGEKPRRHTCAIVVYSRGQAGPVVECNEGRHIVGRAPGCQIRVDSPTVSEEHCELTVTSNRVSLRDLGSTNGTFVRDRGWAVDAVALRDNDVVDLSGDVRLAVVRGADRAIGSREFA